MVVLKVGLIGAGGMGGVHARQYAKMNDVEVRFFDRSADKTVEFAQRTGYHSATSMEQLLDWADCMDICLPTDLHVDCAISCIERQKPTLVEKPMALDIEQCQKLIAAEKQHQVKVMPAQVLRWFPEYRKGHFLVQEGTVGNPGAVRMRRGGKAPVGFEGWFQDIKRSGGVLLDLAIHEFDWLRWTFGEVESVLARSVRFNQPELEAAGDYALITLKFKSGCVGHVEATWMDPSGFRTMFEVCGSEGMIEHDSRRIGVIRAHTASGSQAENPMHQFDDPYYLQIRSFLDAVRDDSPLPVSTHDGMMAVAIARACIESASTGALVTVPTL